MKNIDLTDHERSLFVVVREWVKQAFALKTHNHRYSDISDPPTIPSASNFATATQGEKADSASQPGHQHSKTDITDFTTPDAGVSESVIRAVLGL